MLSFERYGAIQPEWEGTVGEIIKDKPLRQSFTCIHPTLVRLEVFLYTYHRINPCRLWLKLWEGNWHGNDKKIINPIRIIGPLEMESVSTDGWFSFEFTPLPHSRGQIYTFSLESDAITRDQAISVMGIKNHHLYWFFGKKVVKGSIAFKAVCIKHHEIYANFSQCRSHLEQGKVKVDHFPLQMRVEVSRLCNLKCIMCPHSDPHYNPAPNKVYFMSLETFQSLTPFLPYITVLSAFGLGEPFLNPEFLEILRYAKRLNPYLTIFVSTNGLSLKEEIIQPIIQEKLIQILQISIDSINPTTFEHIRRKGHYDKVIHHIKNWVTQRAVQKAEWLHLQVGMVVMKENANEIYDYICEMAELGVNAIRLDTVKSYEKLRVTDLASLHQILEQLERAKAFLKGKRTVLAGADTLIIEIERDIQRAKEQTRHHFSVNSKTIKASSQILPNTNLNEADNIKSTNESQLIPIIPNSQKKSGRHRLPLCSVPWESLMVAADGEVLLCCNNYKPMGSVNQSIETVWNNTSYQQVRQEMILGQPEPLCQSCLDALLVADQAIKGTYLDRRLSSENSAIVPPAIVGQAVNQMTISVHSHLTSHIICQSFYENRNEGLTDWQVPILGFLEINSSTTPLPHFIALALNGIIEAVATTHFFNSSCLKWRTEINGSLFRNGENHLEVFCVYHTHDQIHLSRSQPVQTLKPYSYLITHNNGREFIVDPHKTLIPVSQQALIGHLDEIEIENQNIFFRGWALDTNRLQLPEWIVIFLNNQYLYREKTWVERPDVVANVYDHQFTHFSWKERLKKRLGIHQEIGKNHNRLYSGFIIELPLVFFENIYSSSIRLFAISKSHIASELIYPNHSPCKLG
ncbi:hypothetical protein THII_3502 [Thioploca ingrica]|uniref:Radical SAM core domain-containing protein n=1 Tax=Thioploca ingrica TaxID=40754 RepID=A0A090AJY9_9GAMM|nr:hypothetical protein THII_3502 [Thioploca ingrica]